MKVAIVDDHSFIREGLKVLLGRRADVQIVGVFTSGYQLLEAADGLQPDVALVDIAMHGLNGLDVTRRLLERHPATKVIIVSMHESPSMVAQALYAGVAGYVLKSSAGSALLVAFDAVMEGRTYIDPEISRLELEACMRLMPPGGQPMDILTTRQREILQLMAEGLATKEIAHRLSVSPKTVETHRKELMTRLGIRNVAGLVRYAIRVGVLPIDH